LLFDVNASWAIGSGVVLMVISGIGIDGKIKGRTLRLQTVVVFNVLRGDFAMCGVGKQGA
jgi:hypothetical protein